MSFLKTLTLSIVLLLGVPVGGQEIKIQEGTYWDFRETNDNASASCSIDTTGDNRVVFQNSELKVFSLDADFKMTEISGAGADDLKRMVALGQDQRKYFELPLVAGKKWVANYALTLCGARKPVNRTVHYEVKGVKSVQAPSGEFKEFQIEGWYQAQPWNGKYSTFYSTASSSIIKYIFAASTQAGELTTRTRELLRFGNINDRVASR